ncbi:MAG: polyprenyl synthetase family protein [Propylenella sp.]
MNQGNFESRLASAGETMDAVLGELLAAKPIAGEIARPGRMIEAMRYATLGGGKRLRPFLLVESARVFAAEGPGVLRAAASVEFIHCYSLVHDDLPAMDNDDLRRGRATTHRAYDDATAILVGDSLLTLAFDVLADQKTDADPAIRADLVVTLARASGIGGMAGGQMLDLEAEGRFTEDGKPLALDRDEILRLQAMKTGALITAAAEMGAIAGRADRQERKALRGYGHLLGQAFQIADDLLDVESDAATLGKATGKDSSMGKATLVGLLGIQAARERLAGLVAEAEKTLSVFGVKADVLREAARFVAERKN